MLVILNLDVEDTEDYLQVYFDVTNNSGEVIILEDLEMEVCFTTPVGDDCAVFSSLIEGKVKDLDPNTTMTLKMQADVPTDAADFYVSLSSEVEDIFIQSEVVNK